MVDQDVDLVGVLTHKPVWRRQAHLFLLLLMIWPLSQSVRHSDGNLANAGRLYPGQSKVSSPALTWEDSHIYIYVYIYIYIIFIIHIIYVQLYTEVIIEGLGTTYGLIIVCVQTA